ncbi:type II toxin-antitoxin system PemK/MazF family toxin [Lentibacillus salinarum]|uniref:Type II toxin-antitoxin system PemK/MazF family toxin n=1 Tax=Lentibacillus salinarum TaxID=446820 RepID=A0ABW3ZNZ4_9BACI
MKAGHLYELSFPYEEGQGSKRRPVLIIVVNTDYDKALGLKVTKTGPTDRHPNRIEILNSPEANLQQRSFVQIDHYNFFDNVDLKSRGRLSVEDLSEIVQEFSQYHGL